MPIYKVSEFEGETIFIVRADSKKDIGKVLEESNYRVDGKTIFAIDDREGARELQRIVKIGE